MAYRFSFLVELFVEVGYQIISVLFLVVIFSNVKEIAGWSYAEMLFLTGLNIVSFELFLAGTLVFGLWRLPEDIPSFLPIWRLQ